MAERLDDGLTSKQIRWFKPRSFIGPFTKDTDFRFFEHDLLTNPPLSSGSTWSLGHTVLVLHDPVKRGVVQAVDIDSSERSPCYLVRFQDGSYAAVFVLDIVFLRGMEDNLRSYFCNM